MSHGSATAVLKSLQWPLREDKRGDELASAGNLRFRTMPQICFLWFADEGKRKNWLHFSQLLLHRLQGGVNLHAPQLRFFFFFMLCVHPRMLYLFIHSLQTAPIPRILRLAQPCAILASSVHAPVYFRESAWSLRHCLLAFFTPVCSSHLHEWSATGALLLLLHVARGSCIAKLCLLHTHQVADGACLLLSTAYRLLLFTAYCLPACLLPPLTRLLAFVCRLPLAIVYRLPLTRLLTTTAYPRAYYYRLPACLLLSTAYPRCLQVLPLLLHTHLLQTGSPTHMADGIAFASRPVSHTGLPTHAHPAS